MKETSYKLLNRIILVLLAMVVSALMFSCGQIKKKSKDIPDTDTIEQVKAPSVKEILEWREEIRLDKYNDSVFLAMPEQILTQILVTKGTDLTIPEIVSIYISQKEFYDNIIKEAMNIQKVYIPDSMPKKSIPDSASDTIHGL